MTSRSRILMSMLAVVLLGFILPGQAEETHGSPEFTVEAVFPPVAEHVHGSTVVELSNGDLLAAWFQGSGERWADDVRIMGARRSDGAESWSKPFVMADVPGFPDINPILFVDSKQRLWLVWYTVMANQWETSLLKYRISEDYTSEGPPQWEWQDVLHVKPGDPAERGIQPNDRFVRSVERQIDEYARCLAEAEGLTDKITAGTKAALWRAWGQKLLQKAGGRDMMASGRLYDGKGGYEQMDMGYPYFRRMGWQTKNKAVVIGDRIIVPLYSDGFSFSLMAITDDGGGTWQFSEPLVGAGNIQPSIAVKADGGLVAYMRDNGPAPQRLHISSSNDRGMTWSGVRDSNLPNPGAGADLVTLADGDWVMAYNDTEKGRHRLAVALSKDEGRTWTSLRYIENDTRPADQASSAAYPGIIEARDGMLHVTYSFHRKDTRDLPGKTIRYARFNRVWLTAGDY